MKPRESGTRKLFESSLRSAGIQPEKLNVIMEAESVDTIVDVYKRQIYDKLVVVFIEFVFLPEVSVDLTIQKTFNFTTVTLQCIQRDILFKCPVKFNIFVNCNAQRVFFVIDVYKRQAQYRSPLYLLTSSIELRLRFP